MLCKVVRKEHSGLVDGKRVNVPVGDTYEASEREMAAFPDRLVPVNAESAEAKSSDGDVTTVGSGDEKLDELTKDQLLAMVEDLGVEGVTANDKKADIIAAVQAAIESM